MSALPDTVVLWLRRYPGAVAAADRLLDEADRRGGLPSTLTCRSEAEAVALTALLSARFVRPDRAGTKARVLLSSWSADGGTPLGELRAALASARTRPIVDRPEVRARRVGLISDALASAAKEDGLVGHVAARELAIVGQARGRGWSRWGEADEEFATDDIARYLRLLRALGRLQADPERVERVAHVSRVVAGHTHWLRVGSQPWRDLGDDVLDYDAALRDRLSDEADPATRRAAALAEWGLVENFTSVMVLAFGPFGVTRSNGVTWGWARDAYQVELPVWLSIAHLIDARLDVPASVTCILTVENETSFWDLMPSAAREGRILVWTEGQANRAVIRVLRMLAADRPGLEFRHQGDLDLPGIHILSSLQVRTGLRVSPERMDAGSHRHYRDWGIKLTESEIRRAKAATRERLPCADLLQEIVTTGVRIEQEVLTGEQAGRGLGRVTTDEGDAANGAPVDDPSRAK